MDTKDYEALAEQYEKELEQDFDWKRIFNDAIGSAVDQLRESESREDLEMMELIDEDNNIVGGVYLGSVFALTPSGKYYMPFACSNVTEQEALQDEVWWEALDEIADSKEGWVQGGEGNPCDIFFFRWVEPDEILEALDPSELDLMKKLDDDEMYISIDGENMRVTNTTNGDYMTTVKTGDGHEYYISESSESAGEQAAQYWRDMAQNDPEEFTCIVGTDTLVAWALGQWAGPGNATARSLEGWLDIVAQNPEEEWARDDGMERDVDGASASLVEELGFTPTVAYRC